MTFVIRSPATVILIIIRAHHEWPSQMHEHLLISRVAANQQIWVHLWGPGVMGMYYIMIIIKMLRKCILIDRIFDNRRCQIILDLAVPMADTLRPTIIEFPRAIRMTSRATLKGFSQAGVLWEPARQHTAERRTQLLLCHHLNADKLTSGWILILIA